MTADKHTRPIIISEQKHGLPYSKGLMASSMMATGLPPSQAYHAAMLVEERLREAGRENVSMADIDELGREVIAETVGDEQAARFARWQEVSKIDRPLVVLVGGTTGVGKSTVATGLAHRLGITRIVSTDSIREVMRSVFSEDIMPLLYESSFTAFKRLRVPLPKGVDPVIVGFREQTEIVMTGVSAIIRRATQEGLRIIVEGVHVVPGRIPVASGDREVIVPMLIDVSDEHLHRSHFYLREFETEGYRPFRRYRANFQAIRQIGAHLLAEAEREGMPVIDSRQLDMTIRAALEQVMSTVMPADGDKKDLKDPKGHKVTTSKG
jgi:2-phosphoglycerate kinase